MQTVLVSNVSVSDDVFESTAIRSTSIAAFEISNAMVGGYPFVQTEMC